MAELKTKKNNASVKDFINLIEDESKRNDCLEIMKMMKAASGKQPKMWGESMVGFGEYHYKYASGHEGDSFIIGFSPRKQAITLYFLGGLEQHKTRLNRLGKHKTGKGCLYIKTLADVDKKILNEMLIHGVEELTPK